MKKLMSALLVTASLMSLSNQTIANSVSNQTIPNHSVFIFTIYFTNQTSNETFNIHDLVGSSNCFNSVDRSNFNNGISLPNSTISEAVNTSGISIGCSSQDPFGTWYYNVYEKNVLFSSVNNGFYINDDGDNIWDFPQVSNPRVSCTPDGSILNCHIQQPTA